MKDLKQARGVYDSVIILAGYLGMTENELVNNMCFLDKVKFEKIKTAINLVNDFNDMSVKDRSKALGYDYKELLNGNVEISTNL